MKRRSFFAAALAVTAKPSTAVTPPAQLPVPKKLLAPVAAKMAHAAPLGEYVGRISLNVDGITYWLPVYGLGDSDHCD